MLSGAGAARRGGGLRVRGGVVDVDDRQVGAVQPRPDVRGGDRGDRRGVAQHELHPRRGHRGVDGHVGRAGLEHRHDRDDRLGRPGQQHRHPLARARALAGEQVRQPVGGFLDLAIRPRALAAGDRHRLGGAGDLRGEQLRNRYRRARRLRQDRPVAPLLEPGVLGGVEQIDGQQPPGGIGDHGHQHPLQPLDQDFDAGRVEHLGVEFDPQAQFVARHRHHRQRVVVELAATELGDGQLVHAEQRAGVDRVVLVQEQGVEQLVVTGDAMDLG